MFNCENERTQKVINADKKRSLIKNEEQKLNGGNINMYFEQDGRFLTNPQEVANAFSQYFSSAAKKQCIKPLQAKFLSALYE